jgi:hypothetical protein
MQQPKMQFVELTLVCATCEQFLMRLTAPAPVAEPMMGTLSIICSSQHNHDGRLDLKFSAIQAEAPGAKKIVVASGPIPPFRGNGGLGHA